MLYTLSSSNIFLTMALKSSLIEVRVKKGYRKDLGRPSKNLNRNKEIFIKQWSTL